jgi:hypothetical protein
LFVVVVGVGGDGVTLVCGVHRECGTFMPVQDAKEGDRYGKQVDKIEQYLLEFAKLSEDVRLRKEALDKVLTTSAEVPEEEVSFCSSF